MMEIEEQENEAEQKEAEPGVQGQVALATLHAKRPLLSIIRPLCRADLMQEKDPFMDSLPSQASS